MNKQKGNIALMTALLLPVVLGISAFAIDLAYLQVVRNELQNDADAAALAGAKYLVTNGTSGPDWAQASSQALLAVGLNKANNLSLRDANVETGYWNLKQTPQILQPLPMNPTLYDIPAIKVTVVKDTGVNQGGVPTFFARLWNRLSLRAQATATAGVSSPGTVDPGGLFPLVISQCMYANYWNSAANPPAPKIDPKTGKPYVFQIGSGYHYGTCSSGEWTSFDTDDNSVGRIQNLITQGNPVSMSIGDSTWVEPGTKTTLYKDVRDCSAAGNKTCEYVVVPTASTIDSHARSPIEGFACLHLLDGIMGSKYILAEMSNKCVAPLSGGVGINYGVVSPPSLFQ